MATTPSSRLATATSTVSYPPEEAEPQGLVALFRRATTQPEQRALLWGGPICLGLMALIFWSNLRQFVNVWSNDGNYSHGFLVPLISLYFANIVAQDGPVPVPVPVPVRSGVGLGLGLLVVSILGCLATTLSPVGIIGGLSFL